MIKIYLRDKTSKNHVQILQVVCQLIDNEKYVGPNVTVRLKPSS